MKNLNIVNNQKIYSNPYTSGLWSKNKFVVKNMNMFNEMMSKIDNLDVVLELRELNNLFKQNCHQSKKSQSKIIKKFLENKSGKEFPNLNYSFDGLMKSSSSRYLTITGLKIINKNKEIFKYNLDVDLSSYHLNIDKIILKMKRLRLSSLLRRCKQIKGRENE